MKRSVGIGFAALLITSACTAPKIRDQSLPEKRFAPNPASFNAPDNVAVLHYYGAGGWGIRWRGTYIMTAPYFSNHGLPALLGNAEVPPRLDRIRAGLKDTPAESTSLILVGHGHIDHAGDLGGLFQAGLPPGLVGLIADASVVNMLGSTREQFRCIRALDLNDDGRPIDDAVVPDPACVPNVLRIIPIHSAHAPHAHLLGLNVEAFGGHYPTPRAQPPERANDYKLGYPHAYLIDLLDVQGRVAFRIHYMDAAAEPPHALIDVRKLPDPRDVDVHIGCAPGFDLVTDYPEAVLAATRARFVVAAHWEDFFRDPEKSLALVPAILTEKKMNALITRIESAATVGPILAPLDACDATHACGPRGPRWAVPIPGETLRFKTP